jgi:hypothetical protein
LAIDTFTKQPYEELLITVDFSSALSTGETVSSGTVIVKDAAGTVTTVTMAGTPSVSSPYVTCLIKAGTDGAEYSISYRAVTSLSQKLEADLGMSVVEDD